MECCIKLKSISFLIFFGFFLKGRCTKCLFFYLRHYAFGMLCFIVKLLKITSISEVFSECDNWMTVSIDRTVRKQGFHRYLYWVIVVIGN